MSAIPGDNPGFNDAGPKPSARRRLKLVELLAILGAIGLLIALLLPATRSVGPAARRAQCVNNLKQIALALNNYEQIHHVLPPAYTVDVNGRTLHSWRALILPYLEQEPLYQTIDLSKPWNDPANAKALQTPLPIFRCLESVGPPNTTTYLAIVTPGGCFLPTGSRRLEQITDAHESTLMVIEAGEENAVPWMAPVDANETLVMSLGPTSKLHHAGVTNACFVDGSAAFLKATTPAQVRRALLSISGGDDKVAKER